MTPQEINERLNNAIRLLRDARNEMYRASWGIQEPLVEVAHKVKNGVVDANSLDADDLLRHIPRMSQTGAIDMLASVASECAKSLEAIRRDLHREYEKGGAA